MIASVVPFVIEGNFGEISTELLVGVVGQCVRLFSGTESPLKDHAEAVTNYLQKRLGGNEKPKAVDGNFLLIFIF